MYYDYKTTTVRVFLISALFLFFSCTVAQNKNSENRIPINQNYRQQKYQQPRQYQKVPNYSPYYQVPPASRYYYNPYDFSAPRNGYYDYDSYYVAPEYSGSYYKNGAEQSQGAANGLSNKN